MSIDTKSPETKQTFQKAYERGDRRQDHGTRGTGHDKDHYGQDYGRAKHDYEDPDLLGMSRAEVKAEADHLLRTAGFDEYGQEIVDEYNAERDQLEAYEKEEDAEVEAAASRAKHLGSAGLDFADENDAALPFTVRRQTRGRRGSTSGPDFTYEGTHGDDEDLADTTMPIGGYQIR